MIWSTLCLRIISLILFVVNYLSDTKNYTLVLSIYTYAPSWKLLGEETTSLFKVVFKICKSQSNGLPKQIYPNFGATNVILVVEESRDVVPSKLRMGESCEQSSSYLRQKNKTHKKWWLKPTVINHHDTIRTKSPRYMWPISWNAKNFVLIRNIKQINVTLYEARFLNRHLLH